MHEDASTESCLVAGHREGYREVCKLLPVMPVSEEQSSEGTPAPMGLADHSLGKCIWTSQGRFCEG